MNKTTVERSIWIAAPQARVWQAIADPVEMGQWFLPPALGAQLQEQDGKLMVMMGPMGMDFCRVESSSAPRQLTTVGVPDSVISTTYILEPEKDGTRVTVTMTGFDAFPKDTQQERMVPGGTAWEKALQNLKAYLEAQSCPIHRALLLPC